MYIVEHSGVGAPCFGAQIQDSPRQGIMSIDMVSEPYGTSVQEGNVHLEEEGVDFNTLFHIDGLMGSKRTEIIR